MKLRLASTDDALRGADARARLAAMVEGATDAIIGTTLAGIITDWNAAATRLYGYTRDEAVGRPATLLSPEERHAEVGRRIRALAAGEIVQNDAGVSIRKDGSRFDVNLTLSYIRDAGGAPAGIMAVVQDVTARKQAEQAIRDEKQFSDQLVSSLPGTFGLLNADGRYLRWNARLKALLGLTDAEMAQTNALDVIEPADRQQAAGKLREALQKGFATQEARVTARGLSGTYCFTTVRVETAQGARLIVTGTDITRRKQIEAALRNANRDLKVLNERYRIASAVIESSAEGVMVTDAQLRIESVNPAFEHITGYAAAEAVGQGPKMLFSGRHDEAFFRRLRDTVDARGHWRGEIWNRRQDGTVYPQETSVSVLRDADGHVRHYASVFSDNTVQHQVETKLRELSSLDGLTGIANRRTFDEAFAREWARALRDGRPLSLLMADVDFFKKYNDRHGHLEGDRCLQQVARAIRQAAGRAGDVVARYGGEEFAVILPETDAAGAAAIGEQVCRAVAALRLVHEDSTVPFVTLSIGAATLVPGEGLRPAELTGAADRALYEAKHAGRNRVVSAPAPRVRGEPAAPARLLPASRAAIH